MLDCCLDTTGTLIIIMFQSQLYQTLCLASKCSQVSAVPTIVINDVSDTVTQRFVRYIKVSAIEGCPLSLMDTPL